MMADPIDTDAIRLTACCGGRGEEMADELDRLDAENAALADALADIAGMTAVTYGAKGATWLASAECSNVGTRCCWEYLGQPDGGPEEWCPVCVAEVAWCAWKLGVLA